MNGYATQILRVNLSTGRITTEVLDANVAHCTIGGRGMAAEFLLSEVPAGIDALGPDNKLAVATGPFQNTPIPGGTRFAVYAKSPPTGGWGEAHAAGSFGPMLKRAGYDALIMEGAGLCACVCGHRTRASNCGMPVLCRVGYLVCR